MSEFYVPSQNLIGRGVVKKIGSYIKELGYKKALLVTDHFIAGSDILPKVTAPLDAENIDYVVYSDVDPNPTVKNVEEGLAALKKMLVTLSSHLEVVHHKMLLVVFQFWQQMEVVHKTTKVSTNHLKKVFLL